MQNVLTADEIRSAEARVMRDGVDEIFLRFNAALAVADGIAERALGNGVKTAVFCGSGGNGCDGMIAAAILKRRGADVCIYTVGNIGGAAKSALAYTENAGVPVMPCAKYKSGSADIIVDAIFGIGLNRTIVGDIAELIAKLNNESEVFRLAVDIPSGLNADSGEVMGVAFHAHITLSFSCYKRGMLFGEGREYCGKIISVDVGVATESKIHVYENGDFKPYRRRQAAHKGTAGRVYVIGGCGSMIGAPIMAGAAAHAAYLNGAGIVTVCLPRIHQVAAASRSTMTVMKFLPDTRDGFIKFDENEFREIVSKATAINIGMGMGNTPDLKDILKFLCANFGGALIVDADALNAIKLDYDLLRGKAKVIVTPHVGEFERLTGMPATIDNAVELAKRINGIVALKSATTIITDGNEVRLNITGTPAMAKGGTGDVLGGCIAALSCSYSIFDAATVACYRNGLGAERAVSSYAQMMLTPNDILHMANYPEI